MEHKKYDINLKSVKKGNMVKLEKCTKKGDEI